jgi:hypothetical protein
VPPTSATTTTTTTTTPSLSPDWTEEEKRGGKTARACYELVTSVRIVVGTEIKRLFQHMFDVTRRNVNRLTLKPHGEVGRATLPFLPSSAKPVVDLFLPLALFVKRFLVPVVL